MARDREATVRVALGVVVCLLVIAGPAAGQAQTAVAGLQALLEETPQTQAGTYEATVIVNVTMPGGTCLCERTFVTVLAEGDHVEAIELQPEIYQIEWAAEADANGTTERHTQHVDASIMIDEPRSAKSTEVTFDAEMQHKPASPHISSESEPATLHLPTVTTADEAPEGPPSEGDRSKPAGRQGDDDGDPSEASAIPAPSGVLVVAAVVTALARDWGDSVSGDP